MLCTEREMSPSRLSRTGVTRLRPMTAPFEQPAHLLLAHRELVGSDPVAMSLVVNRPLESSSGICSSCSFPRGSFIVQPP